MINRDIRQPSIFLPHGGGPCFFMDWTWGPADTWEKTRKFLEGLAESLPAVPKAILVVSGHWEEPMPTVSTAAEPKLIFDYTGFPEHTYRLTWPAPGNPQLANRVVRLLKSAGLQAGVDTTRGFDHGVFVPLKIAFPEAKIPVVTLSLAASLDPPLHLAVGRALSGLREEGVLIVGSGMSFHNLRAYMRPETADRARQFDEWLTRAVDSPSEERSELLSNWRQAPFAEFAHPREEHLVPLFVAAGAGGESPGKLVFSDDPMGAAISAYRFDG